MTEKKLTKAQEKALKAIKMAEDMAALLAAVDGLKAEERNDKRVSHPVYMATQRIVGKTVPL